MVLLSAAICTKSGRLVLARQFADMTRGRVEGLVSAFAKLALDSGDPDKQDTTIETESVRYLYQPMEDLVLVLVTSKGSNVIEDQDTLHTFAKVVSSYCPRLREDEVRVACADIALAFDQAVTPGGHKERVTIGQIRSFVEMDSHDEKMAELDTEAKKRAAQSLAAQKAKELREARERAAKMAAAGGGGGGRSLMSPQTASSSSSSSLGSHQPYVEPRASPSARQQQQQQAQQQTPSRGMQLGKKSAQSKLVDQIAREELGQRSPLAEQPTATTAATAAAAAAATPMAEAADTEKHEAVHLVVEESVTVRALNDGTVEALEVKGELSILASTPDAARAMVTIRGHNVAYQWKTHPQIDKARWANDLALAPRDPARPFPVNAKIAVLKWHLAGSSAGGVSEADLPLAVTCWPSPAAEGMIVSMEYELRGPPEAALENVLLAIPVPGDEPPEVGQVDGDYNFDRSGALLWRVGNVSGSDRPSGSIEFSSRAASDASAFFPIDVTFSSRRCFSGLNIATVTVDGNPVPFSTSVRVQVAKYTISTAGH